MAEVTEGLVVVDEGNEVEMESFGCCLAVFTIMFG